MVIRREQRAGRSCCSPSCSRRGQTGAGSKAPGEASGARPRAFARRRRRRADGRHSTRAGQASRGPRRAVPRAHRRDHQQRGPDAALASRTGQDRGLGPHDRCEHQGGALWRRSCAAAHEGAAQRSHYQCFVGCRPQGAARRRRIRRNETRGARPLGGTAAGGQALQHPDRPALRPRGAGGRPRRRRRIGALRFTIPTQRKAIISRCRTPKAWMSREPRLFRRGSRPAPRPRSLASLARRRATRRGRVRCPW